MLSTSISPFVCHNSVSLYTLYPDGAVRAGPEEQSKNMKKSESYMNYTVIPLIFKI